MRIGGLLATEDEVAMSGKVVRTSVRRPRRRLAIVQARVADESGEITAVWFNQVWLADKLHARDECPLARPVAAETSSPFARTT